MKLQENQLFANRYLLQQKIGIGGFSEVWKAADEYIPGMTLALKIYATERGLDKESIELFSGEYMMTKSLRHKHLVEVIYYDVYQQSPYLVMPFYSCGSLAKSIHDKGLLSEDQIARLMLEIGDALNYLHTQDPPVLHRDIKPDNILIDDTGKYLLSDFGISRRVRHTIAKHTGKGSEDSMSIAYSAPERFSKNPQATEASDIFSLGVMFYQVCTGFLPWDENGGIALLRGAEIPDIPLNYSRKLNQIINQCMEVDSAKRPTAGQLKEWANTFLQEGYWKMNPDKAEIKKTKVNIFYLQ
jgi:serine/threonine-protein kinase